MKSFVEFFNIRFLAEFRKRELIDRYGADPDDFMIYYDRGIRNSGKWVLVYEP